MSKGNEITAIELAEWVDENKIHILFPGTELWQEDGCYTAYKNFAGGVEMAENENPVRALIELKDKL